MKKEILVILALIAVVAFIVLLPEQKPPVLGDVHVHADFKVFLDGIPYNFSQEKYMSGRNKALSNFIHLHDMEGDVIHQHMSGVTLGQFFTSLGMQFNSSCFVTDEKAYCTTHEKRLRFFVNGRERTEFDGYVISDRDRILITYGNVGVTVINELTEVTDKACIYSGTCPERGSPPEEGTCNAGETCIA